MAAFRKIMLPFFMVACMPFVVANDDNVSSVESKTEEATAREESSTVGSLENTTSVEITDLKPSDEASHS